MGLEEEQKCPPGNGTPRLNVTHCVRMALVHDIGEAIVGDITPHCGVSNQNKFSLEESVGDSYFLNCCNIEVINFKSSFLHVFLVTMRLYFFNFNILIVTTDIVSFARFYVWSIIGASANRFLRAEMDRRRMAGFMARVRRKFYARSEAG